MNPTKSSAFRCTLLAQALIFLVSLIALPAAFASTASDDLTDLSLEDLMKVEVISASKFIQSSSHAPSAVQVLTAEDIHRHGWRTLAEALDSLPGLYASTDRAFGFVGARGFMVPGDYNMRFLLLLDGQPLNDNLYDQANLGHEFRVDMALIERIEYVPGPGSSIYGSNAMFGVINVITRSAKSLPTLSIGTQLQSDGWRELNITSSHRLEENGPELIFSLSRANKSGRDLTYPNAIGLATADGSASKDGVTHLLDNLILTRAFVSLKQDGLAVSAWAARRDVHPSSALYGSNFDDSRLHLIDSSYGLMGAYQRAINSDLNLNLRLAFQKITYQGDAPYFDQRIGSYVNRDEAVGAWISGEVSVLYAGFDDHRLISGIDFQSDIDALQKNADLNVTVNSPISVDTKGHRYGIFLQDEWKFLPDWRLNAGLRSDTYSRGDSNLSPRFALIWSATENATLKLLAGRAYRTANAYEAFYARNPYYIANPHLASETIRTLEAVGEYHIQPGQEIGISLFDYKLNNLVRQLDIGGGVFQYQNQAAINANGVEIFHKLRRKNGLDIMSSVAFDHSRDAMGQALANSPRWIGKLRASKPVWVDVATVGAEFTVVGPRLIDRNNQRSELGMQSQLNLSLTTSQLLPGVALQLRVVNALNKQIVHPASDKAPTATLPMDGRQWQLGLNYAF